WQALGWMEKGWLQAEAAGESQTGCDAMTVGSIGI
ncbi:hypothetical protein TNCV_2299131, partial [Trichonephila clavipes]